jgi:O-antigen/teichoic acid export membrane protein
VVPEASPDLVLIAALGVPGIITATHLNGLMVADDRIGAVNGGLLLTAAIQTLAVVVLLLVDRLTVAAVVATWLAAQFVPLLVVVPVLGRRIGVGRPELGAIRGLVSRGLRYHGGNLALLLLLRVDVLMLQAYVDDTQLGLYTLSVTLAEFALLATSALAQVSAPLQLGTDRDVAVASSIAVVRANTALAMTIVFVAIVLGPYMIPLIFGREFAGSYAPLLALSVGILAMAVQRPLANYLTALDRPWRLATLQAAALGVNVTLNLLLIPRLGISGAALASAAAYLVLAAACLRWASSTMEVPARTFLRVGPAARDMRRGR